MAVITLTTDFGSRDGYVGAVKGVIARGSPNNVRIVDIAHDIPRGDIAHAAWVVRTSTLEFAAHTVHLVVVDPGVGTDRQAVIVHVNGPQGLQTYVGPDNGVFAYLDVTMAWQIETKKLSAASATFHGRDIFAPAAAAILRGNGYIFGPETTLTGRLPWGAGGHIVHVDHYGNLISDLRPTDGAQALRIGGHSIPLVRTYGDVATGTALAYVGSAGTYEVAVRDGRADTQLGITRGAAIAIDQEGPYR